MHLYVGVKRDVMSRLTRQGGPVDHRIVAIGPRLGNYMFLLVGNGADLRDNSFM
jgi:hypothetical protein